MSILLPSPLPIVVVAVIAILTVAVWLSCRAEPPQLRETERDLLHEAAGKDRQSESDDHDDEWAR